MINVEIWASGGGSNADVIANYFHNHPEITIRSIGCNRKEAGVFRVAKKHNIDSFYFSNTFWNPNSILKHLEEYDIHFIVLAGFLKLVPYQVTQQFEGKIINIHPSLLPLYGGKNMYGDHVHNAVLNNQENYSGITIHEANEEFDKGKIIAQYTVVLDSKDDLWSLKSKIQRLEHTHYASTIHRWIESRVQ